MREPLLVIVAGIKSYGKNLFARLSLAIVLALFSEIFYLIFSPLTLFWSYYFLKLFIPGVMLIGTKLITIGNTFSFVPACTAASAYLLLALLILLTKGMSWMRRIELFVWGSLGILAFNIFRIELLLLFFFNVSSAYSTLHLLFWKFLSTLFVFLLWIMMTKRFKIRNVPIYSDLKYILSKFKR